MSAEADRQRCTAPPLQETEHGSSDPREGQGHQALVREERTGRVVDSRRQFDTGQSGLVVEAFEDRRPTSRTGLIVLRATAGTARSRAVGLGEPARPARFEVDEPGRNALPERPFAIEEQVQAGLDGRQAVDDLARGPDRQPWPDIPVPIPVFLTIEPQVLRVRQLLRPRVVDFPQEARHVGEPGRDRRGEALRAREQLVPAQTTSDEQGLDDTEGRDGFNERPEVDRRPTGRAPSMSATATSCNSGTDPADVM